ncbi:hypothetical protein BJ741DRAFT_661066 [Chytriomyces cf. hyalinus JEL632]|nr:hypothetical protein BJ741DRAFT_661066 [Chytriomyces cf. hyalinus JEL632]
MTSVVPSDLVPGRTRSASAETSKSPKSSTLHQSLMSNIVYGLLAEIQSLVQILDAASSSQEPLHKQLGMVALLFDSLAPMLPNFDSEIAPLIAEFCTITGTASMRASGTASQSAALKESLARVLLKITDSMRNLSQDTSSRVGAEIVSHKLLEVLDKELSNLGSANLQPDRPSASLAPTPKARTFPRSLDPTDASSSKRPTDVSPTLISPTEPPKSPGIFRRVLTMMTRPKSAIDCDYKQGEGVEGVEGSGGGGALTPNQSKSFLLETTNTIARLSKSLSKNTIQGGSANQLPAATDSPLEPVPKIDPSKLQEPELVIISSPKRIDPSTFHVPEDEKPTRVIKRSKSLREMTIDLKALAVNMGKKASDDEMSAEEEAERRVKPIARSKSMMAKDNDVLLMRNEPNLPSTKSMTRKQSTKRAVLPTNTTSSSHQSIAAALFGDPSIPLASGIVLSSKEHVRTFAPQDDTKIKFNLVLSNLKMKIISQITQKTMIEIDLSKWEADSTIVLNDLREDYKRTEMTEILRHKKNPNLYSVCAHTLMYSNLVPLGQVTIESPYKITVHTEKTAQSLSKPLFSLTGEIETGRFMIIGRAKDSRVQKDVGHSSGWVAKRSLKIGREEVCECRLEIEEHTFYDQGAQESSEDVHKVDDPLTKHSQLLMAGIALALAPKDIK